MKERIPAAYTCPFLTAMPTAGIIPMYSLQLQVALARLCYTYELK